MESGGGAEEIRAEERAECEGSEAETLEEGAAGQVGIHGGVNGWKGVDSSCGGRKSG
jgi:hypothetical protein